MSSEGASVAALLLPLLDKKAVTHNQDTQRSILTSVLNLVQRVDDPSGFVM